MEHGDSFNNQGETGSPAHPCLYIMSMDLLPMYRFRVRYVWLVPTGPPVTASLLHALVTFTSSPGTRKRSVEDIVHLYRFVQKQNERAQ